MNRQKSVLLMVVMLLGFVGVEGHGGKDCCQPTLRQSIQSSASSGFAGGFFQNAGGRFFNWLWDDFIMQLPHPWQKKTVSCNACCSGNSPRLSETQLKEIKTQIKAEVTAEVENGFLKRLAALTVALDQRLSSHEASANKQLTPSIIDPKAATSPENQSNKLTQQQPAVATSVVAATTPAKHVHGPGCKHDH